MLEAKLKAANMETAEQKDILRGVAANILLAAESLRYLNQTLIRKAVE